MHRNAPILLRDICVSFNMELFCRTNIKPRNALPVMLDCSSMVVLDSKSIAHAMGCACRKLLRDLSEYDLIQCIRAYSLAPVRVTSSVRLNVQGLSLYDDTRTTISGRLQRTV